MEAGDKILEDILRMLNGGKGENALPRHGTPDYASVIPAYQQMMYPTYREVTQYKDEVWRAKEDFTHLADKRFIPMPGWCMPGILGYTQVGADWMVINTDAYPDTIATVQLHEIRHRRSEYVTRLIEKDIQAIKKPRYIK